MTIYGIKTCSTVGKARKFMKEHDIEGGVDGSNLGDNGTVYNYAQVANDILLKRDDNEARDLVVEADKILGEKRYPNM